MAASTTGLLAGEQIVLILVGLIGSGKSTFAQALEEHYPNFLRCNQDDLGDRRKVETLARKSLAQGLSVCIDRTNFDASQRSHWIKIAQEFSGTKIWVIVFDTPYKECERRIRDRKNHPTITSVELGLDVLARFASDFREPEPDEGYERIIKLSPSDCPSVYTAADISAILDRVRDSPLSVVAPRSAGNFRRGSSFTVTQVIPLAAVVAGVLTFAIMYHRGTMRGGR